MPKNASKEERKLANDFVPKEINGFPVDLHKWTQAHANRPGGDDTHVTQVSSVEELNKRAEGACQGIMKAKERMAALQKNLE